MAWRLDEGIENARIERCRIMRESRDPGRRFASTGAQANRPKEKRGSPFPSGLPLTKSAIPGFVLGRRGRHDGADVA